MHTPSLAILTLGLTAATVLAQCDGVRLAPPTDPPPIEFGASVANDGRFWFVGDNNARTLCPGDPFNCSAGAVHVYEMVGGRLEFFQTLSPPNPALGDFFGTSLDADAGRLIVGTMNYQWPGTSRRGGAFVYEYEDGAWTETGRLIPPETVDPLLWRLLGVQVAIDGDMAMLTPLESTENMVFRYRLTASGWEYAEHFAAPNGGPVDAVFGHGYEILPDWVFISAPWDSSVVFRGGSVYAYRRLPDGSLEFAQRLTGDDAPGGALRNNFFGASMSVDDGRLAIGVPSATRDVAEQGSVQIYDLNDGRWQFSEEVVHEHAEELDQLGYSASLHGNLLVASATGDGAPGTPGSGYAFRRGPDGQWRQAAWLVPQPPVRTRQFGYVMASDGRHALFGAREDELPSRERPGAAYLFDLTCTDCPPDLDADGALTIFDFLTFLNLFEDRSSEADFDGDGELTIFDFLAFQTAFDAGCA